MYQPYTTRKQNLQTSNITHSQLNTIKRTALQQKQIQDLQHKVDIILMHNEQLINENNELRKLENVVGDHTARFRAEESQNLLRKMKMQIAERDQQNQQICKELIVTKDVFGQQIQVLNSKIRQLFELSESLKQENILLLQKIQIIDGQSQSQVKVNQKLQKKEEQIIKVKEQKQKIQQQSKKIQQQNKHIQQQSKHIQQQKQHIQQQKKNIQQQKQHIQQQNKNIQQQKQHIQQQKKNIQQQKQHIQQQKKNIQQQNKHISQQNKLFKKQIQEIKIYNEKIQKEQQKLQQEIKQLRQQREEIMQDKKNIEDKKLSLVQLLQQSHHKDMGNLRENMQKQFQKQLQKIQQKGMERCSNQRRKAQNYIKEMINAQQQVQKFKEEDYQREIQILRESLQTRKKVIEEFMGIMPEVRDKSWFEELVTVKERMKELMQNWMRQSQLLKLKMSQQYEVDVRCMSKSYEDHIELLSEHIKSLQLQNDNIRTQYEEQINEKLRQKHYFELQISKLKNIIRKLKVQLHGIHEEFRINIDGVKENNNTFSMSLLKSANMQKDKANFYEEQNRKLRKAYDTIQVQLQRLKVQTQQKCKYYQEKYEQYRKQVQPQLQELRHKQNNLQQQIINKQKVMRQTQFKSSLHYEQLLNNCKEKLQLMQQQKDKLQTKLQSLQLELKMKTKNITNLQQKIAIQQADLQKLMLDMQTDGVQSKKTEQTILQWKSHYERIVKQLQHDKQLLKQQNQIQSEQLGQLVQKYKQLQGSLQQTLVTMKKKSKLQNRIIQLGLDNNLVKNMEELFGTQHK